MRQTNQLFVKGLNERIPKDRQTPDRLNKLQNARLDKRGETLFVTRVEGADEWHSVSEEDYVLVLDQSGVTGDHDVTTYKKGWLIRFEDVVDIDDISTYAKLPKIVTNFVRLDESFQFRMVRVGRYVDEVIIKDSFKLKTFLVLKLSDEVSVVDNVTIPNRLTLTFGDSVEIVDRDLECLE